MKSEIKFSHLRAEKTVFSTSGPTQDLAYFALGTKKPSSLWPRYEITIKFSKKSIIGVEKIEDVDVERIEDIDEDIDD